MSKADSECPTGWFCRASFPALSDLHEIPGRQNGALADRLDSLFGELSAAGARAAFLRFSVVPKARLWKAVAR
jgi:hypothetical protein